MLNGLIKLEYNYFGYVTGSFKLSENPVAQDFNSENVVMRGSFLKNTPLATCLVLNVGVQCIGSVFKDPRKVNDSQTDAKLQSYVETQRQFDKAYKQSIRLFHMGYMIMFVVISLLSIYLSSNTNFSNLLHFEQLIIESKTGLASEGEESSTWEFSKYFLDK